MPSQRGRCCRRTGVEVTLSLCSVLRRAVLHQFLHADDAALAFAHALGRRHCIGQSYNVAPRGFHSWQQYYTVAMRVIGQAVPVVAAPVELIASCKCGHAGACVSRLRRESAGRDGQMRAAGSFA